MKIFAATILTSGALVCSAHAQEPLNLFFSVAHVKPEETRTLGIVTQLGGRGSSQSYTVESVPVETVTGGMKTLSSVQQTTGFGAAVEARKIKGNAVVADVSYTVKKAGVIIVEATKTVRLEHGQSADLAVMGAEKLVVSFQ